MNNDIIRETPHYIIVQISLRRYVVAHILPAMYERKINDLLNEETNIVYRYNAWKQCTEPMTLTDARQYIRAMIDADERVEETE